MSRARSAPPPRRGPATQAALRSRLLRTPKRGERTSDDAGFQNDDLRVYALSDGATRSFLGGPWAEILARHVGERGLPPRPADVRAWLEEARGRWELRRSAVAAGQEWWTSTPGRAGGATLFALGFEEAAGDEERPFAAVMHGDTCGFHVRGGRLVSEAMPCRHSSDFSMHPECLMSIAPSTEPELRRERGTARPGDSFFLATDALAKWILTQIEAGRPPWKALLDLDTQERFEAFADAERGAGLLDEDDISLLVVELVETSDGAHAEAPPEAAEAREPPPRAGDGATARDEAPRPALARGPASAGLQTASPARPPGPSAAASPRSPSGRGAWSPTRPRVAETLVDAAQADVPRTSAAPLPHGARWRERLLWSVLVPAIVSFLVSAAWSCGADPDDWPASRGRSGEPGAAPAPVPASRAATHAQETPSAAPSASSAPSERAPAVPSTRLVWANCGLSCKAPRPGDRVKLKRGTKLCDDLEKDGEYEALQLDPPTGPRVNWIQIEIPVDR